MPTTEELIRQYNDLEDHPRHVGEMTTDELIEAYEGKRDVHHKPKKTSKKAIQYTPTESLVRGAIDSASLGFADELQGASQAGVRALTGEHKVKTLKDLMESYRLYRDVSRENSKEAFKQNPGNYLGGTLIGTAALGAVPGLGWINAAKNATLGGKLKTAAKVGLLYAPGFSEADLTKGEVGQFGKDILTGGAVGAAVQGGISTLTGPVATVAKSFTPKNAAKVAANVFLNTPPEITETYMQNPKAVLNGMRRFQLVNEIEDKGITPLQRLVTQGSAESREILKKEGVLIPGSEVSNFSKNIADNIEKRLGGVYDDPQRIAAIKWLRNIEEQYAPKMVEPKKTISSLLPDASGNISKQTVPPIFEDKLISTNRLKDSIQSIDRNVDWEISPGHFSKIDEVYKKELRKDFDIFLKSKSKEYAKQMEQVASDTDLLNRVSSIAKSPQGWTNVFRRIETDKYGAGQIPAEVIKELDERLGTSFIELAKYSNAKEAFDKSITNGSRNVNFFSYFLKDIPLLKHLGFLVGGSVDKYGRKMTMHAVDGAIYLNNLYEKASKSQFIEATKPLRDLARKGDPQSTLTFNFLKKINEKAAKQIEMEDRKHESEGAMKRRAGAK